MRHRGRLFALILLLATFGCDRVTKYLATVQLADAPMRSFLHDTVRLQYAENTGAFLSLGSGLPPPWRTALLTVGVGVLLLVVAVLAITRRWTGASLAGATLMWAGGVSNLVDRAMNGHVVDFLNVGVGSLRTGIFNVADVAVTVGAVLIVFGDSGQEESLSDVK